jgi:hypothetical protein
MAVKGGGGGGMFSRNANVNNDNDDNTLLCCLRIIHPWGPLDKGHISSLQFRVHNSPEMIARGEMNNVNNCEIIGKKPPLGEGEGVISWHLNVFVNIPLLNHFSSRMEWAATVA